MHGPSTVQAAGIFTKPFVSAEKWNNALRLLAITPIPTNKTKPSTASAAKVLELPAIEALPRTGRPVAKSGTKRLIVEVYCHPESKLSQTDRKWSEGCEVLQFTEELDLNESINRESIARRVNSFRSGCASFDLDQFALHGGHSMDIR